MAASTSGVHAGDDHGDRATPLSGTQLPALQARRAMDAAVLASDPTLGALKVWTVVANYTLGYGRSHEELTHGRIASEAGVSRETVRRALKWLTQAGIIAYRAGFGDPGQGQGQNSYSRLSILLPKGTPPVSGVPSREWGPTPPVSGDPPHQPEGTRPLPPVGTDPSGERGNRERATEEDIAERGQTNEDTRGVVQFVTEVQIAREGTTPTPESESDSVASTDLLPASVEAQKGANDEEEAEPESGGDLSTLNDWLEQVCPTEPAPDPTTRRVGAATGEQAVVRFMAETGLPLSARIREALARSLAEVAGSASPNEMLLGLGYWHERRQGRWPEDAAERVTEAMAFEHGCLLDPCNAMPPADAIQEGRCRAKMAALTPAEREAAEADPFFRIQGFGLDWPAPPGPDGLLSGPRPQTNETDPFSIPLSAWRQALAPQGAAR